MRNTLLLFDVDGTLTSPRQRITEKMRSFILNHVKSKFVVGLVGGSDLSKIVDQMGPDFKLDDVDYLFPENGLIAYKNGIEIGRESISNFLGEEKSQKFVNYCLQYMSKLNLPVKRGTFIEYRTGLINVSPVGRSCSREERNYFEQYDLKHKIREEFVKALQRDLPDVNLKYSIGGQISFDAFPHGWDKRYCLKFVEQEYKGHIHFFGDKTFLGGNDYEIFTDERVIGHSVNSPDDTYEKVQEFLQTEL